MASAVPMHSHVDYRLQIGKEIYVSLDLHEPWRKKKRADHPEIGGRVEDPGNKVNTVIKYSKDVMSNGIISLGNEAVNPFLVCLLWFEPTRMHYQSPSSKTRRRFPATVFVCF